MLCGSVMLQCYVAIIIIIIIKKFINARLGESD